MLVIVVLFITFKKLPFLIRYVPDQYKTQKMCDKAILENGGTLKSIKIKTATKIKKSVIKEMIFTLMN